MCTRFVYNGDDMITGFNFDIDLTVWKHKVIKEKERFILVFCVRTAHITPIMGFIEMEMSEHCCMCMTILPGYIKVILIA